MSPLSIFLLRLNRPIYLSIHLSPPCSHTVCFCSLTRLLATAELTPVCPCLSLGIPKPDTVIQMWSHKCQIKEKDLFPDLIVTTAQYAAGLLGQNTILLTPVQFLVHKENTNKQIIDITCKCIYYTWHITLYIYIYPKLYCPQWKKLCLKKFCCNLIHSGTNRISANYIMVDISNHYGSTQLQKRRLAAHQIQSRSGDGMKKRLSLASDFPKCADFLLSIFAGYAFLL